MVLSSQSNLYQLQLQSLMHPGSNPTSAPWVIIVTSSEIPQVFVLFCFVFVIRSLLAHVNLKLKLLLPQPPKCCDYRHAPSTCPASSEISQ
jgi:hypothetical protein